MTQTRIAAKFALTATLTPIQLSEFGFLTNSAHGITIRDLMEMNLDPYDMPTALQLLSIIEDTIDLSILDVDLGRLNWTTNVRLVGKVLEVTLCLVTDLPKAKGVR